jgi:sporulation protein YlmC with PRC-barrel domain
MVWSRHVRIETTAFRGSGTRRARRAREATLRATRCASSCRVATVELRARRDRQDRCRPIGNIAPDAAGARRSPLVALTPSAARGPAARGLRADAQQTEVQMTTKLTFPRVLSASTLAKNKVRNAQGETLGDIKEIMLDVANGRIAYAVLSFGGFLGVGDKLFAIPWDMLRLDTVEHVFVLDVTKEQLKDAQGFDKNNWPDFAQEEFHTSTYDYWEQERYWSPD